MYHLIKIKKKLAQPAGQSSQQQQQPPPQSLSPQNADKLQTVSPLMTNPTLEYQMSNMQINSVSND